MSKKTQKAAAKGKRRANGGEVKPGTAAAQSVAASAAAAEVVGAGLIDETAPETAAPVARARKGTKDGMAAMPALPKVKKARKPKAKHECACGCKNLTGGKWAPGHDARANAYAIRIERDLMKLADVPANERAGAKLMLEERKAKGIAPGATHAPKASLKLVDKAS